VDDPRKYRVTLICRCVNDYAEGYGPTPEAARATAYKFFYKDNHKPADMHEEILEHAVEQAGGSHYEEV
jgi:hypothetical protein